ncbi:ABC transporter permease [Roseovarius sp. 217]|jgi:peptide/nickel transport system permease protein|uniref:ABC transporter permease n=1 Tax=Roseovarius sp. (strain 217) TaxID=314264 RepID=UPI000068700C|nr:ABC transporter permease [Roseovarius sp. 217]EAQ23616.1 peptide ABC transporter, permease protein [Roseovarius sp. 217]
MSAFVIIYYTLLLGASCLAAYFNKRSAFLLLFSLTLVSFILGIIGGVSALRIVAILAGLLGLSAMVSYAFREFLIAIASHNLAKELRTAPLTAAFGMFVIFTVAIAGIFAPLIAPYGEAQVITSAFAPADANMLLGADQLGRDVFSRLVFGARNTVALALAGTVMAFLLGALAGLLAATTGGWFDQALARTSDVIMSIPSLIFALLMLSIFGGDLANDTTSFWLLTGFAGVVGLLMVTAIFENSIVGWAVGLAVLVGVSTAFSGFMLIIFNPSEIILILVVAVIYSPRVFRLTRAVAGNVVVMDYIEAAKLRGEKTWYLIRREILPNSTAPLVAEFGLEFCFVFLLIAGLSFLGLGIQPPTADWGSMVRENATLISFGDITPLIPAAAIALLTVAVNFVVDWMLYRSSGLKV